MTQPAAPRADATDALEIRHVRTQAEFEACFELQAATWGAAFREAVPATILKVSQRLGGVTAGAFATDGTLAGFVFGMTGVERGEIVHWSDMLAVRADMQNHGLGRRLKEFQRDAVRALGVARMYWTYDPLVARNAHFNLNRLGARVSEYVVDMYGTNTGSAMHSGFGTDRFIVVWPVTADADAPRPSPLLAGAGPVVNEGASDGRPVEVARFAAALPERLRVEIPLDVFDVRERSLEQAVRWRTSSRAALRWALASGYVVDGFVHDEATHRGFYALTRTTTTAAPETPA